MVFKKKRSGIIHNFETDVDPGYKYIEKFREGFHCYMMDTKEFISIISFTLRNEDENLVSFNGRAFTFRLSIKKCSF